MSFIILLITSYGLANILFKTKKEPHSFIDLIVSFFLIPIILFFSNLFLPFMGFDVHAKILFVTSVIMLILSIVKKRRFNFSKLKATHILILVCMLSFFVFDMSYIPHRWDEFSHWALMPKQIFMSNSMVPTNPVYPHFVKYTPGWPTLLAYPQSLFLKAFDSTQLIQVPVFLFCLFVGATYDSLRLVLDTYSTKILKNSILWIIGFIVLILSGIIPNDLLVEFPIVIVLSCVFLSFYLFEKNCINENKFILYSVILIVSSFLIKNPLLLFLPAYIYFFIKQKKIKRRYQYSLLLIIAGILVQGLWSFKTYNIDMQFDYSLSSKGLTFRDLVSSKNSYVLIWRMIKESFMLSMSTVLIPICGVLVLFKDRDIIKTTVFKTYLFTSLIYLLGLYWFYFVAYGGYTEVRLNSYDRYYFVLLAPLIVLFMMGLSNCINSLIEPYCNIKYKKQLLLFVIFSSSSLYFKQLGEIPERELLLSNTKIKTIFKSLNDKKNEVMLISQNTIGKDLFELKYNLAGDIDFSKINFYSRSFGNGNKNKGNKWYYVEQNEALFYKQVHKSDLILAWKNDAFSIRMLQQYCSKYKLKEKDIFYLKKMNGKIECKMIY